MAVPPDKCIQLMHPSFFRSTDYCLVIVTAFVSLFWTFNACCSSASRSDSFLVKVSRESRRHLVRCHDGDAHSHTVGFVSTSLGIRGWVGSPPVGIGQRSDATRLHKMLRRRPGVGKNWSREAKKRRKRRLPLLPETELKKKFYFAYKKRFEYFKRRLLYNTPRDRFGITAQQIAGWECDPEHERKLLIPSEEGDSPGRTAGIKVFQHMVLRDPTKTSTPTPISEDEEEPEDAKYLKPPHKIRGINIEQALEQISEECHSLIGVEDDTELEYDKPARDLIKKQRKTRTYKNPTPHKLRRWHYITAVREMKSEDALLRAFQSNEAITKQQRFSLLEEQAA